MLQVVFNTKRSFPRNQTGNIVFTVKDCPCGKWCSLQKLLFLTQDELRKFLRKKWSKKKFPLHFRLTLQICPFVRLTFLSLFPLSLFPTCYKTWYCFTNDHNKTFQALIFEVFFFFLNFFSVCCHIKNNGHWAGGMAQCSRGLAEFARRHVQFLAPMWWLTTPCHSASRGSDTKHSYI